MSTREVLDKKYPHMVITPITASDIPRGKYMVYILTIDDKPFVVGHGKHNRAKVIFDDSTQITSGHIKALFVRIYHLFGDGQFQRYIIPCNSKNIAQQIEADLHDTIGGNNRDLPVAIRDALFHAISPGSPSEMVLRMALCSSFDGISDIKLWRREGILADDIWETISEKLHLDDPKR